jgi:AraC-like DNA-binding protein
LQGAAGDAWIEYRAAIIQSRQPHALDATAASYAAVVFVEPETKAGRALAERYAGEGIASLDDAALTTLIPELFAVWLEQPSAAGVSHAVWRIIGTLTRGVQASVVTDPRIERAVAYINSHLSESISLDDVAREAYLSPSRFRHLFVEQTGMAMRPYILWRRLLKVWELLMAGESLSTAAHAAGFADSAHLTRTSRRMFGVVPSGIRIANPLPAREEAPQH